MYACIRKLTNEEQEQSKLAKKNANELIKNQRKDLTKQMEKLKKQDPHNYNPTIIALEKQREDLYLIDGFPVVIELDGYELIMDYELLLKYERSFCRSNLRYDIECKNNNLRIRYYSNYVNGEVELYQLPNHQTMCLRDLPKINLEGEF